MRACEMSQPAGNAYRHAGVVLRTRAVGKAVMVDFAIEVAGCEGAQAADSNITPKIANARIAGGFPLN